MNKLVMILAVAFLAVGCDKAEEPKPVPSAPPVVAPIPVAAPAPVVTPTTRPVLTTRPVTSTPNGYRLDWSRVSSSANVDLVTGVTNCSVDLSAVLTTPSDADVIALGQGMDVTECELIDDQGKPVERVGRSDIRSAFPNVATMHNRYFNSIREIGSPPTLNINIGFLASRAAVIRKLAGSATVILAVKRVKQELAADGSGGTVDVGGGLSCWVDSPTNQRHGEAGSPPIADNSNPRNFTLRYSKPFGRGGFENRNRPPMILSVTARDDKGRQLAYQTGAGNFQSESEGYYQLNISSPDRPVKTIVVEAITEGKEVQIPFTLTNIPLP